jgi:uncharacterized protein YjbJ (UPF0337 family)
LTGNRHQQAHGKAKRIQGTVQQSLGDIQNVIVS